MHGAIIILPRNHKAIAQCHIDWDWTQLTPSRGWCWSMSRRTLGHPAGQEGCQRNSSTDMGGPSCHRHCPLTHPEVLVLVPPLPSLAREKQSSNGIRHSISHISPCVPAEPSPASGEAWWVHGHSGWEVKQLLGGFVTALGCNRAVLLQRTA